jgi:hypothetical protein
MRRLPGHSAAILSQLPDFKKILAQKSTIYPTNRRNLRVEDGDLARKRLTQG